jgi:phage terminase large subunit-like protein
MFDQAKAERSIRFLELLKLTGDFHGQPFNLMAWQRKIVSDVYGTMNARGVRQYRYVYVETAKKNAKSQLTAGIGIKHLFDKDEPNGQIFLVAGDRNQAQTQLYNPIVEMIEQDPALLKRVKITDSVKLIENKLTGTTLKVISAEAYTKHGLNVSCCIFDELHAQPNRELWDVMTKGAGLARRQPIWWVITTAGKDPDRVSIAWEVHEKVEGILKARKAGDKEKDIPHWYGAIYSYTGDDIYNEKNWKKANPSLGITLQIEDLRQLANEAKLDKADELLFRWLNLCQWVTIKLTTWLPLDLFDATNGDWSRNDLLGADCYLGMDLSTTTDLSAICMVFPPQEKFDEWRIIWDCWVPEDNMQERIDVDHVPYDEWAAAGWIHPTKGDVIDYTKIKARIQEVRELYNVLELDGDRSFATMLWQELEEDGLTCVDIPQSYVALTDPLNHIEIVLKKTAKANGLTIDAVAEEKEDEESESLLEVDMLSHEPHPVARWCFGNTAIAKNGNGQKKYVKEHKGKNVDRTKRIDLTVAWVCAMARAKFYESHKSVYSKRGIRTVG